MGFQELVLFIVQLLAGTGVFLVGVHLCTENIEQLATGKIKDLFSRTADRKLANAAIGAGTTALIQSSGVTTVLIVGFVNVGTMNLHQAAAMIMGANIGTTITAQIAALSAFPITTYFQILIFIGIMMGMMTKRDSLKKTGMVLAGFGLIFAGLALMSQGMKASRDSIQLLFENVTNPFLLFLIGIFLTALVQSSSATTSVIIAMSVAGLTVGSGGNEILYIVMGTNIGSCVTALMSSLGAGANARRTSLIHLLFNSFGALLFFVLLLFWPNFMRETFQVWFPSVATQIAMFHTFFNVACTALFLPFTGIFVKISELLIREKQAERPFTYLDKRMLASPSLAIGQLEKETLLLAGDAMDAFRTAYRSFADEDISLIDAAQEQIDRTNGVYRDTVDYLVQLSAQSRISDEHTISNLHDSLGDVMRIAEIADNFTKYARRTAEKHLDFSETGRAELDKMVQRVEELYLLTREVFEKKDSALLPRLDSVEEDIDGLRKQLIDNHIGRLKAEKCNPDSSGIFVNMVSNLERLGDHLTYIAHAAVTP